MTFTPTTEPFDDDDEAIRHALAAAEIAPLMAALASITGDASLLRDGFRPSGDLQLLPDAGISIEDQIEARAIAFDVLRTYRDGGCVPRTVADDDELRRTLGFLVGTDVELDEYLPLFREELGIAGEDARAPAWNKQDLAPDRDLSVVIIGAGMSGIVAAHRLAQAGVDFVVLEKDDDVGGTWLENTYPGCRVDVPNHFYSYSFAQLNDWPQHYSTQDVLLRYFRRCADEFALRQHIRFGTEVESCTFDEARAVWTLAVRTSDGATDTIEANVVVSAVGQLNRPLFPDIAGRDTFGGPSFHSARWDHGIDLAGKRVAVIGTGASAVQFIPPVADQASELVVFQRTPPWLLPTPEYHDEVPAELHWLFRHVPTYAQWYRFSLFWRFSEGLLPFVEVDPAWMATHDGEGAVSEQNEMLRTLLAMYIQAEFYDRPDLLDKVMPSYPPMAKRFTRDNGIWARTLKRDDVQLVTDGIEAITPTGLRTVDGVEHEVDVIIYGTGFQASNFLTPMRVVGCGGAELHATWDGEAGAYLGMTVPEFPNLFLLYGPNTNIVVNGSIIFFSECEVTYLLGALRLLLDEGKRAMDCRPDVYATYRAEMDTANRSRAWGASGVNSWYKSATGKVTQNWPFTCLEYWQRSRRPDPQDYVLLD